MPNSTTLPFAWSAVRAAAALPTLDPGWVWLVGAGPGDPGLLTLHALNALQQADIIVYDALVDQAILKLARPGAGIEYAGKRGGKASPKQRDISLRLIELARGGKRVVRLKGGDPFLFGRGGEEALALVAAQIPFRIVPGVSAGIGGLAYAGIPVTHRDVNHAVTFVTGHMAGGEVPDTINWRALSAGSPVIVIYMGLKHLPRISAELIAAGRSGDEPVAIVSQATTDRQQVLETTLSRAAVDAEQSAIQAPALIVVGQAVRLRAGLDWLSAALHGRKLDPNPLGKESPAAKRAG
jgi:uroporphyrin-III C-methyltransferase